MRRTIQVFLGETQRPVGIIRYDLQGARESASFQYDSNWLAHSDGFIIDPSLPLVAGPQFHPKTRNGSLFHSVIADTEPDGWARRVILRDHAKQRQEAKRLGMAPNPGPLCALNFLLAVDDLSRVGALRFQDENGMFQRETKEGRRTAPPLIELADLLAATRAVEQGTESAADLQFLLGRATSLGGLRPKCTVMDDSGILMIGKFPSVADERAVTKGEVLAMRLARLAGLDVADARLVSSFGTPVALIRRFDRKLGKRILYVSAATLLGAETDDGIEHSYTDIVDILRIKGAAVQIDVEELWRRIAYSILITNVDDHLHNHGFLHVYLDQWKLAPAFDLNPFPDRMRELKTWISEETGPEATIDALMSVIRYFNITAARAKEILEKVESAVSSWRKEGRSLGMTESELESFADAFEHGERAAAVRAIQS